jgi:hypothetical protein
MFKTVEFISPGQIAKGYVTSDSKLLVKGI